MKFTDACGHNGLNKKIKVLCRYKKYVGQSVTLELTETGGECIF